MVFECLTILAIMVAITVINIFRKSEEHEAHPSLAVPFMILPAANIIANFFSEPISKIIPYDIFFTNLIIDVVAVIVSGMLLGLFSFKMKSRTTKISYIVISFIYNIVLMCILLQNLYISTGHSF